jgi:hypothetical protein
MTNADLTAEQARAIACRILPTLEYLGRLHERMLRRGFTADDPLMANVMIALEAMRQLRAGLRKIETTPASSPIAGAAQIMPEVPQWRRATGGDSSRSEGAPP